MVGLRGVGDLGEDLLACALGERAVGGVHDDLDGGAGVAAEVLLGELAGSHGLRAVGLPAGAGQLGLHPRCEHPEADDEEQPHRGGDAGVVGDPDPDPAQGAGAVAEVGVGARCADVARRERSMVIEEARFGFGCRVVEVGVRTGRVRARAAV